MLPRTLRDEVKRIGIVALAIAALLVILALLLALSASDQVALSRPSPPLPPPQARMVRTERFVDYPSPYPAPYPALTAQERAAGIVLLRQAFAAEAAAAVPVYASGLPAWLTAETRSLPLLPLKRAGEAPTAAAAPPSEPEPQPQGVAQTETGRPDRAACSRHGLRTVWSGQYRWRCRR